MGLLAYGLVALAVLGALAGFVHYERKAGGDEVRTEWAAANVAAQKKQDAETARQDALRAAQDAQATRRLADEKKRTAGLMVSLDAHIKASGTAAACPVPSLLVDDWNAANAGPKGVGAGTVPPVGPKPAAAR